MVGFFLHIWVSCIGSGVRLVFWLSNMRFSLVLGCGAESQHIYILFYIQKGYFKTLTCNCLSPWTDPPFRNLDEQIDLWHILRKHVKSADQTVHIAGDAVIKLHESDGERGLYTALSYCWGKARTVVATPTLKTFETRNRLL